MLKTKNEVEIAVLTESTSSPTRLISAELKSEKTEGLNPGPTKSSLGDVNVVNAASLEPLVEVEKFPEKSASAPDEIQGKEWNDYESARWNEMLGHDVENSAAVAGISVDAFQVMKASSEQQKAAEPPISFDSEADVIIWGDHALTRSALDLFVQEADSPSATPITTCDFAAAASIMAEEDPAALEECNAQPCRPQSTTTGTKGSRTTGTSHSTCS